MGSKMDSKEFQKSASESFTRIEDGQGELRGVCQTRRRSGGTHGRFLKTSRRAR
jgi:hypothetical protein